MIDRDDYVVEWNPNMVWVTMHLGNWSLWAGKPFGDKVLAVPMIGIPVPVFKENEAVFEKYDDVLVRMFLCAYSDYCTVVMVKALEHEVSEGF